ncbi:type II toxin-antitoxin system RelE/ParE family toxin [Alsobacter sp. KACC 23698]|uniref:Type II toxin-antitoxin system RelE/ParE family toxin n=1 Tax=Alsobacter sp. KACC 23698 TaxID=3149229 RepID=A0AAU7JBR2_9HYPH
MIRSFRDRRTEQVFAGKTPKGFPSDLIGVARRKLRMIDAAAELDDLRAPPGNRLESLQHDLRGRRSIRINDQFRVCFVWSGGDAFEVEIIDYLEDRT